MAQNAAETSRLRQKDGIAIATAVLVTTLDGFDAFSFNLVAPLVRADLNLSTASLGPLFASTLAGMILGATGGGILADKIGRLRVLILAIVLFGAAAFALPFAGSGTDVIINRLAGGAGLGAAAPIAIGLLNRALSKPASPLVVAAIMAGIPLGGALAALFNYLVVPTEGWRSIFYVGGLLALPVIAFAYLVFGGVDQQAMAQTTRPSFAAVFRTRQKAHTMVIAAMFFFGYVVTAIFANWLPTILTHRGASPLLVSATFGALTIGSIIGSLLLGFIATKARLPGLLPIVWTTASLAALTTVIDGLGIQAVAVLSLVACMLATGAQGLSVALTNKLYHATGMETTAIGLMMAIGRIGQTSALGMSGLVITFAGTEMAVFAFAGISGIIAALFGFFAVRSGSATEERHNAPLAAAE